MAIVTYETFYTGSECVSVLATKRKQHFEHYAFMYLQQHVSAENMLLKITSV
jgi:hypothetical protein